VINQLILYLSILQFCKKRHWWAVMRVCVVQRVVLFGSSKLQPASHQSKEQVLTAFGVLYKLSLLIRFIPEMLSAKF